MLAGIVDNEIYIKKESVCKLEIGRDEKVLEPACRMQNRERERGSSSIHSIVLLENFFSYSVFFCYYENLFYIKEKPGLFSE